MLDGFPDRKTLVTLIIALSCGTAAAAGTEWTVHQGRSVLVLNAGRLQELGLTVVLTDQTGAAGGGTAFELVVSADSTLSLRSSGGVIENYTGGEIRHTQGLRFFTTHGECAFEGLTIAAPAGRSSGRLLIPATAPADVSAALELGDLKVGFDAIAGLLLIEAGDVTISPALAKLLGDSGLQGEVIGSLTSQVDLQWTGGDEPSPQPSPSKGEGDGGGSPRTVCGNPGPDVIVGDLTGISNYASVGGIEAFAVGTDSCNVGDTNLLWIASTNEHPVIAQNMYRFKTAGDGSSRFEQIGQSWLKHGFTALTMDICGCGCNGQGGSVLGVGCSDPYSSGLNGDQSRLGPRFEVNPYTGYFLYPFTAQGQTGDSIYKRLQVHISDLDPAQQGGGQYFVEGHYVTPDDAAAGNQANNVSYRPASITGGGSSWSANVTGQTVREKAAIEAWPTLSATVQANNITVPGDGLLLLGSEVTNIGGGFYHYEYALFNQCSERAVGSFILKVGNGATVQNVGFHDVDYHSGEPFDGTDWTTAFSGGVLTWSTSGYASNPNANALRWGTTYNFRFDVNTPPVRDDLILGLFKPGTPTHVLANVSVPTVLGIIDCNGNGIDDATDIANGTSQDCNANTIPDECETFDPCPLGTVQVAGGLSSPVFVGAPPGDLSRLFIVEQPGRIKILNFGSGSVLPTPFLDITSLVSFGGEQGLLSMAFHPNYAVNGYFYVNYTNTAGNTVVARYTVSGDPNVANPASAVILKTIVQDFSNHNGGQLQFGPDGRLYVGMGDGGSGGDPNNRAQSDGSLLGKMLRLDVDNPPNYIPADNPAVRPVDPIPGWLPETWQKGTRNPWRFSFDRLTGDLYIADVGQNAWEEVDFAPASSTGGENWGWRCYEGNVAYNTAGCGPAGNYDFPIHVVSHSDAGTCSISGGYVYRGCAMLWLSGTYFFADYCGDYVRTFRYVGGSVTELLDRTADLQPPGDTLSAVVSFGEDAAGELYIVSLNGKVWKLICEGGGGAVCGNGVVEAGEECDDGNNEPGDGCFDCQLEDNDACANAIVACPGSYSGTTAGMTVDGSASCGSSNSTPDAWYSYTPGSSGSATIATCGAASYDSVISVHTGCPGTSGNQVACDDDGCGQSGGASTVTISVTASQTYLIRVSGYSGSVGTFTLTISGPQCTASVCGNGIVEPGEECDPPGPTCDANCQLIQCETAAFEDDFENGNALGWNLYAPGSTASTGAGVIGDPVGTTSGGQQAQPENAYAGVGCLFTAQNTALGNDDVDGGVVYFLSPTIDLAGAAEAQLSFVRWFYQRDLGDDASGDFYVAQVSNNDGGTWTTLESLNDSQNANTWTPRTFALHTVVTLTSQMKIRFGASDGPATGDIIELAIDDVAISIPCIDCNANGVDDAIDIASGDSLDINGNGVPDECEFMGDPIIGGKMYDKWWTALGLTAPTTDHPLWQYRPDQTSNPSTGSATWRCKECHGWDYKGVDGQYGSGTHRTGFPGILGTIVVKPDLFTLLKEPPNNGGGPGVLNGHDYGSVMSDAQIQNVVAFVGVGLIDDDNFINAGAEFLGDPVVGQANYTSGGIISCITCHGVDGQTINFGTPEDPEWLGTVAVVNPWEFLHKGRFGQPGTPMPSWLWDGGDNQGMADIGRYAQLNFCITYPNGDMNDDGATNGADISLFATALLNGSTAPLDLCRGDFSTSGVVDYADLPDMVGALLAP